VFIALSGMIGVGKSTLSAALAEVLHLPLYKEPVDDNVYLADFYTDKAKHGFAMQVYLLNRRFQLQQQIIWGNSGGILDRTTEEDKIFAKMLCDGKFMDERDHNTYLSLCQHMSNFLKAPNLIIHLDVSPEKALERIRNRNRTCESGITIEYLRALHAGYQEFLKDMSRRVPVIMIDYETFSSVDSVIEAIVREYRTAFKLRVVHPVS